VSPPILRLERVSKVYPGAPPVTAVREVTLCIGEGERVAVTGASGSGKTTLLHVMGILDRPTSGTVTVAGRSVAGLPDRELSALRGQVIGFVFQQFALLPHLSALANVATGIVYRGGSRRERLEIARQALAGVGLADRLHHRPGELSGGEQQRVAIARALAGRPRVLLADEPTGNLDSATGAQVLDLMSDLATGGIAVVVVTHDPGVAAAMERRVALADGAVQGDARR
jgi:putative ABC transport system ATP-binding protein